MAVASSRESVHRGAALFKALSGAVKNALLYGAEHPRFRQTCADLADLVHDCAAESPGIKRITYLFRQGKVLLGRLPLSGLGASGVWLERILSRSGFGGLSLELDLSAEEAVAFVTTVASGFRESDRQPATGVDGNTGTAAAGGDLPRFALLGRDEAEAFQVEAAAAHESTAVGPDLLSELDIPTLAISRRTCQGLLTTYKTVLNRLTSGAQLDYGALAKGAEEVVRLMSSEGASHSTSTERYFDDFTFHHSVNVCLIATATAARIVKDPALLNRISVAALLHDVGKSFLPAEIIHKPGKLDASELTIMRTHPTLGARTLISIDGVDPLSVNVAFGHHLHDGPGAYPQTRQPYTCDWITRLVSVIDIYEALTAVRPYKPALSPRTAFEIMATMDGLKDKMSLVRLLYDCLGPFPLGSIVELNTGERGVVVERNESSPYSPKLAMIVDRTGNRLSTPVPLDLAQVQGGKEGAQALWIERGIVAQCPGQDPLTSDASPEASSILGRPAADDENLMSREG